MIINRLGLTSVKPNGFLQQKNFSYDKKNLFAQKPDIFTRKTNSVNNRQQSKCSFRGEPWILTYCDIPVQNYSNYSGSDACYIYKKLALGNYLDTIQESWYQDSKEDAKLSEKKALYDKIRTNNLSFLDKIQYTKDKEDFIDNYKELTGFPDLKKTTSYIRWEILSAASKAAKECQNMYPQYPDCCGLIKIGYNPVCSVGHDAALPGSDMDGGFIIIHGTNDLQKDAEIVERFKGYLWNNTDQRILSYNHPAAFPQIYTLNQIRTLLNVINYETQKMNLHNKISLNSSFLDKFFNGEKYTTLYQEYEKEKDIYNPNNYISTNTFFIELCKRFSNIPKKYYNANLDQYFEDYTQPSKELIKNFGFFLEVYRNAYYWDKSIQTFIQNDFRNPNIYPNFNKDIFASYAAYLLNPLQIHAILQQNQIKDKITRRREELNPNTFNNKSIDYQFDYIKNTIKSSYGDGIESNYSPHRALLIKLGHKIK